ncbi:MAG: hypothetical protein U1F77_03035 [Kiritimatiellia bacterium]
MSTVRLVTENSKASASVARRVASPQSRRLRSAIPPARASEPSENPSEIQLALAGGSIPVNRQTRSSSATHRKLV